MLRKSMASKRRVDQSKGISHAGVKFLQNAAGETFGAEITTERRRDHRRFFGAQRIASNRFRYLFVKQIGPKIFI
jgi:Ser-tRNA(Ala) deacylase AlaX